MQKGLSSIPRVFHRIWLGGEMPAQFCRFGRSFEQLHPSWEMKLWTEDNLPRMRNQAQFDQATTYAQKADILRYEILLDHGGVYLDTDFECLKPLDELLEGVQAFSATEDTQWISIGIMGAVPGHSLFQAVVNELPKSFHAQPLAPINQQTGPLFFTKVATDRKVRNLDSDFIVYPSSHFYPYRIGEEHLRAGGFPQAYAVHHWAGSWLNAPAPVATTASPSEGGTSSGKQRAEEPLAGSPDRVLLGFDPAAPEAALAILVAYSQIFSSTDPVELGLYAYAEPSLPLLECIQQITRALVGDPDEMAPLSLCSRADLSEMDYVAAYFPTDDAVINAAGTAATISAFHGVKQRLEEKAGRNSSCALPHKLKRDLLLKRATEQPQGNSKTPVSVPASSQTSTLASHEATIHGASLGNGRMLISTTSGFPLIASADDLSLTPELLLHGQYDRPLTQFIKSRLAPGHVAFDIGANIGLFTIAMARAVGQSGHVVAYEAMPENFHILQDNVSMNYMSSYCTLKQQAAWSSNCELVFQSPTRFRGNGSLCMDKGDYMGRYPGDTLNEIKVSARPASIELARFEQVALAKIDVEGAEFQVISGMREAIESRKLRTVVFECVAELLRDDFEPLLKMLGEFERGLGLRCYQIDNEGSMHLLPLSTLKARGNFTQVVLAARE